MELITMDVFIKILIFILSVIIGVEVIALLGFDSSQLSPISSDQFSFKTAFIFLVFFTISAFILQKVIKTLNLVKSSPKA